jgi:hypothetical protein
MALQHFARYLRVARLIGANQTKLSQAVKKQESAKARKQQRVGAGTISHRVESQAVTYTGGWIVDFSIVDCPLKILIASTFTNAFNQQSRIQQPTIASLLH